MAVKYKINFASFGKKRSSYSTEKDFTDENHFKNYIKFCQKDESRRKVIGWERIYGQDKNYSIQQLQEAFNAGKNSNRDNGFKSFESWFANYFKTNINN